MTNIVDLLRDDPGEGELNLRSYLASVVGPMRVAHGNHKIVDVSDQQAVLIATNPGSREKTVMFVEVQLAPDEDQSFVTFGAAEPGQNAITILLSHLDQPGQNAFHAVLIPDNQLFALVRKGGAKVQLMVSQVNF